jgi:putative addiction module killer protein
MITLLEYLDAKGASPFAQWFHELDTQAALKVNTSLSRKANGNFSQAKGVGKGIYECRIDWGPGYRIYFGKDGNTLVILLAGGTKKRQQNDIENARKRWQDYKNRRK